MSEEVRQAASSRERHGAPVANEGASSWDSKSFRDEFLRGPKRVLLVCGPIEGTFLYALLAVRRLGKADPLSWTNIVQGPAPSSPGAVAKLTQFLWANGGLVLWAEEGPTLPQRSVSPLLGLLLALGPASSSSLLLLLNVALLGADGDSAASSLGAPEAGVSPASCVGVTPLAAGDPGSGESQAPQEGEAAGWGWQGHKCVPGLEGKKLQCFRLAQRGSAAAEDGAAGSFQAVEQRLKLLLEQGSAVRKGVCLPLGDAGKGALAEAPFGDEVLGSPQGDWGLLAQGRAPGRASAPLGSAGATGSSEGSHGLARAREADAGSSVNQVPDPTAVPPTPPKPHSLQGPEGCLKVSAQELRSATKDYSRRTLLCEGPHRTVFQGVLLCADVAVKRFHPDSEGESRFKRELSLHCCVWEPSIVTLMAWCEEDRALVYEFMAGGTLQQRLETEQGRASLPWETRLQVAADMVGALLALRSLDPPLVHRNLRPGNILLSPWCQAKLGGLGMALEESSEGGGRVMSGAAAEGESAAAGVAAAEGESAYGEPGSQGRVMRESDTLAVGLLLLHLLTGRPEPEGFAELQAQAQVSLDDAAGALAKSLDGKAGEWPEAGARGLGSLALSCCALDHAQRPELEGTVLPALARQLGLPSQTGTSSALVQQVGLRTQPGTSKAMAQQLAFPSQPGTSSALAQQLDLPSRPGTSSALAQQLGLPSQPGTSSALAQQLALPSQPGTSSALAQHLGLPSQPGTSSDLASSRLGLPPSDSPGGPSAAGAREKLLHTQDPQAGSTKHVRHRLCNTCPLEDAFRKVLEDETRAVDARLLLRCASLSQELSTEDTARVVRETASGAPDVLVQQGDDFPGFQAASPRDGKKKKHSRNVRRHSGNGKSPLPMFPEPDESADATPTGNTRHSAPGDEDSLPLFPSDDDERGASSDEALSPRYEIPKRPHMPASLSMRGEGVGETKNHGLDDIEVPGVVWGAGTPAEVRTIATGDSVGKLMRLAKAMTDSGLEDACLRVYRDVRRMKVLLSLKTLDLGPTTTEEVEGLTTLQADEAIKQWKLQIKVAMHSVMAAERVLCSQCLSSASWLSDQAFHSLGEDVLALLLPVADALADGLKSEAKLVLLLDLYDALVYLMPFWEEGFPEGACSDLRLRTRSLLDKVRKAIKQGFRRFEEFILKQQDQDPERGLPNGSFSERGLLIYVMEIIKVLSGYTGTLEAVFEKAQLKEVLEAILDALEKAIEKQAKEYNDDAQSEFFLMNNLRYIAMILKDLSFKEVLTDRWVNRRNRQVERHATAYQKIAWGSVLAVLDSSVSTLAPYNASQDRTPPAVLASGGSGSGSGSGLRKIFKGVRADAPRDKLEEFSQAFAKVYWEHRSWLIPDRDLRTAVQTQLATRLLDRYRPFLQQSSKAGHRRFGGSRHQSTAFTEEAMRKLVFELFKGHPPQNDDVPFERLVRS